MGIAGREEWEYTADKMGGQALSYGWCPMDADSLRHKAHRYRELARSINDEKTVAILEEMARELEAHARAAAAIVEFVPRAASAVDVPRRKSKRAR
jgi:hypothetical protein